jgi:apolipoprotein D and lipocalin family protein
MKTAGLILALALTTGMAFAADMPKAPEPAKPVEAPSFYAGRWYEIGRTPMRLTDGCVAGYTDYQPKDGGLYQRDACRDKTPDGEEKVIGGPLKILNPGQNTKVHVTYHLLVNLYTRDPRPVPAVVERMTRQIREMGYAGELEFPAQAKP